MCHNQAAKIWLRFFSRFLAFRYLGISLSFSPRFGPNSLAAPGGAQAALFLCFSAV